MWRIFWDGEKSRHRTVRIAQRLARQGQPHLRLVEVFAVGELVQQALSPLCRPRIFPAAEVEFAQLDQGPLHVAPVPLVGENCFVALESSPESIGGTQGLEGQRAVEKSIEIIGRRRIRYQGIVLGDGLLQQLVGTPLVLRF